MLDMIIYHENETVDNADVVTESVPEESQENTNVPTLSEQNNVSEDFYTQVLEAQQTANELQAVNFWTDFIILMLILVICLYLIIKNNITRHF